MELNEVTKKFDKNWFRIVTYNMLTVQPMSYDSDEIEMLQTHPGLIKKVIHVSEILGTTTAPNLYCVDSDDIMQVHKLVSEYRKVKYAYLLEEENERV